MQQRLDLRLLHVVGRRDVDTGVDPALHGLSLDVGDDGLQRE